MSETKGFSLATTKSPASSGAPSEKTPGTALQVTPVEVEVQTGESIRYEITPKLEEAAVQQYVLKGDVSAMKAAHQVALVHYECKRLGVDMGSHVIDFLEAKGGKLKLYYNSECATQMKNNRGAKCEPVGEVEIFQDENDRYARLKMRAIAADGRDEVRSAVLCITGLKGQEKANALMKVETKASRRAILALFGVSTWEPGDGEETVSLKQLVGKQAQLEQQPPSAQSLFAMAGKPLVSMAQPTASNQTAEQVAQESTETQGDPPKEEAAAEAEIVSPSSEAQLEPPKTSADSESNTATETAEAGADDESEEEGLDSIFSLDEEDEALKVDPRDGEVASDVQIKQIVDEAAKYGWTGPACAKVIGDKFGITDLKQITGTLLVGECKQALEWFQKGPVPGSKWV